MAKERWMGPAKEKMKRRGTEGSFRAIARRHGRSTHAEAEHDKHKSGNIGQKARMALAFESARHKK